MPVIAYNSGFTVSNRCATLKMTHNAQVFEFLKGAITKNFKDDQIQHSSKFLQELLPQCNSISSMILDTVKNRSG